MPIFRLKSCLPEWEEAVLVSPDMGGAKRFPENHYNHSQNHYHYHDGRQYNHHYQQQVRWSCLEAEPRLRPDAQGEGEGWGDQQDDTGERNVFARRQGHESRTLNITLIAHSILDIS